MGKKTTKDDDSSKIKSLKKKQSQALEKKTTKVSGKKKPRTSSAMKQVKGQQNDKDDNKTLPFFGKNLPLTMIDIPNLKQQKQRSIPQSILNKNVVIKLKPYKTPELMDFTVPRMIKPKTCSSNPYKMILKEPESPYSSISELRKLLKPMPRNCNCGNISPSDLKMISVLLSGDF